MKDNDRLFKLLLLWIAVMLTLLVAEKFIAIPLATAQGTGPAAQPLYSNEPVEIIVKGTVKIDVAEWSDFPDRAIKVKIDDPWPARVTIDDDVEVKGELRLKNY